MSREHEAEYAVIGSLLLVNESFWKVADKLTVEDFTDAMHRRLFALIGDQVRKGEPADPITLGEIAGDAVCGYAQDCQGSTLTAANVITYAEIVQKHAEGRRLARAGDAIARCDGYEAAQAILAAVRPLQTQRIKTMTDALQEMVEALQRRYDATGDVSGVPTGLESLDKLTSGWQAGNLIIVAARPGMGKSAFALQAALAAGRTFYASLEMTAGELVERAVSNQGAFPHRWIRFPNDAPDHASALVLATSKQVARMPLLIDDSTGLGIDAICSRIRQAHMVSPLQLAVIDHLGLIELPGKFAPSELGQVTSACKRLAKELQIPVMLLCQLNRGVESRVDKRPTMADLRDSGRIEEDADIVLGLYREEQYVKAGRLAGYMECLVLKNRSGETGTAWAKSLLSCMRLESCNEPEQSAEPVGSVDTSRGFQARATQGRNAAPLSRVGAHHG